VTGHTRISRSFLFNIVRLRGLVGMAAPLRACRRPGIVIEAGRAGRLCVMDGIWRIAPCKVAFSVKVRCVLRCNLRKTSGCREWDHVTGGSTATSSGWSESCFIHGGNTLPWQGMPLSLHSLSGVTGDQRHGGWSHRPRHVNTEMHGGFRRVRCDERLDRQRRTRADSLDAPGFHGGHPQACPRDAAGQEKTAQRR
jgi:hypothetical protein